jgi:hypothetical protein
MMGTATATKPADSTGTSATGEEKTHKLNKKHIDQIVAWETEADGMMGEADNFRANAAALIVKELDAGATERQVAEAIHKSNAHVHFAAVAWRNLQGDEKIADFNTAYKLAKRPPKQETEDGEPVNPDSETAEHPFPPWAKQVREFNRLTSEMITQANLKQIQQYLKLAEKQARAASTKLEDLESVGGNG